MILQIILISLYVFLSYRHGTFKNTIAALIRILTDSSCVTEYCKTASYYVAATDTGIATVISKHLIRKKKVIFHFRR